jgi:hypothetical protein
MDLPDYWMPRPGPAPDVDTVADFDRLLEDSVAAGSAEFIDYQLTAPKWQFLCHAADTGRFVLHGTGDPAITMFEPRQPDDPDEFSGRRAVFAAMDGIWPMYFAILDRDRYQIGLLNASIRRSGDPESYYFFSISRSVLEQRPYREGVVYLLPADGFEPQPPIHRGTDQIRIAQAINPQPVAPVAKITIRPEDFPFLDRLRGHDHEILLARIAADPDGFPWLEEV